MDWLADPNVWIGFFTLFLLEVVLGIDNIIFISILSGKLPAAQQPKARSLGLLVALVTRVLLLLSITWMAKLTTPLFSMFEWAFTGRDLILLAGGLFLIGKSVTEIHTKLEGEESHGAPAAKATFGGVIGQIVMLDVVFSLDSVITAVGMSSLIGVMIAAVLASVGVMLAFAGPLSAFVERHPTIQMLALSFLVLIGVNLVADGCGYHIPKGYTYFAMAFAVLVEMLNLRLRKRLSEPVHLRRGEP